LRGLPRCAAHDVQGFHHIPADQFAEALENQRAGADQFAAPLVGLDGHAQAAVR